MKLDAALQVIRDVCAAYVGTLGDHEKIQRAMRTIEDNLKPKEGPKDASN